MPGENNLSILLKDMKLELDPQPYAFISSSKKLLHKAYSSSLMLFRENEGETVILPALAATDFDLSYERTWARIILTIHSDPNAVGFLTALLPKLAEAGISVNPFSAFYHDHLFVPWEKRTEAIEILSAFSAT